MRFENRHWVIFDYSEVSKINFEEVCEYSVNTLRKSLDGTKVFVKWVGNATPSSVSGLSTYSGPYNHTQIKEILSNSDWHSSDSFDFDSTNNPDRPHIPEAGTE